LYVLIQRIKYEGNEEVIVRFFSILPPSTFSKKTGYLRNLPPNLLPKV